MDFPAYLPAAVRTEIAALIEGNEYEPHGWATSLASAEQQLSDIDKKIENCIQWGNDGYLPGLRRERVEASKYLGMVASNVDCLRRLAYDERMRDAYAILTREFIEDSQWCNFIRAAWAARMDFSEYRERLKLVIKLKDEIADRAEDLARLIRQLGDTGVNGPEQFYSIPKLLRETDNHEMQGRNLHMWRSMCRHILGDLPNKDTKQNDETKENRRLPTELKVLIRFLEPGEKPHIDPKEEARNTLRYAWDNAPDFPSLLDTLAKAGRRFNPSETKMIDVAINSRQKNLKTEYLRAFGNLLINDHDFIMTTPIRKAIAIVANVAINLPDVDVTYDDVRKVLAKLDA